MLGLLRSASKELYWQFPGVTVSPTEVPKQWS